MGIPFVDPILQLITQDVYGCLKKRCLILIHFKKNFIDLEEKKKELEKLRGEVEDQVEKAREQSEVIIKEVSEWMVDMEKTKKEVDVLLQEKTGRESIVCFRLGFPNYISRYRLSKRAEEKTADVQKKIDGGNFSAVSGPAPPPPELQLPPTIGEYKVFESRAVVLNKIKDALKENDVVGIHGAGGVGKTTMAAEVAKQLQSEGCIHEVAMAVVSQDPDVKRIQGKLASCLKDFRLDEMENKEERARKLWNRLKNGKSNLVILDDLWGKINLREIGIPVSGGNKDCKLLITSRQPQEVWKDTTWDSKLHVKLIPIEQLKDKEAWELFKNHAGDSIESSELHLIASQVCKKCGGLPVAIRAVGEALKDKKLYEWSDALTKLEKSRMERIVGIDEEFFRSLKLSYEMLKSEEARKCFLLCCLFPDDAEISIEDLVMHCKAARFVEEDTMEETRCRVHTLIKHLKERCLLLDVADEENSIKVHDVIRDVGVSISKEGTESLQLMHGFQDIRGGEGASSNRRSPYIAMWLRKFHFEDDRVCPDAGTLVLQWNGSSFEDDHTLVRRANNFLSREDLSLKVFVLYGLSISSLFPSSCESLANLRMLWLDTWKEDDKNILVHVGKLEVLRISAAEFVELPTEVGLLTGLLVLDLRNARGMKKIPYGVLSKLTRLEELYLPQKIIEWENGEDKRGGSELNCLKRLTTLWTCSRDSDFFNGLFLDKLKRFHICVNTSTGFSGHFTKVLEVSGVSLTPELRGLMGRAEKIRIQYSVGSSEVINHGGISYNLKELEIESSSALKCVEGEAEGLRAPLGQVGLLENLTKLFIDGCWGLEYIFSEPCARSLRQLRHLRVKGCRSLVSIIRGVEEEILEQHQEDVICFDRLRTLVLEDLPYFVGFYYRPDGERSVLFSDKIGCPSLSSLTIINLRMINDIWVKQSVKRVLKSLVYVYIRRCWNLETIISEKWKENQQTADGDITLVFPLLRKAFLYGNNNFKSFYFNKFSMEGEPFFNSQVSCPALDELRISGGPKIVWDEQSYKNFPNLKLLDLWDCSKIEVIVSNQGGANGDVLTFPQLRELQLRTLQLQTLGSVKSFYTVRSLPEEEPFFNHQVECPVLEVLTIDGLSKIKKIWDEQSYKNFPNLKDLSFKDCHEIESIVSNQGKGNRVEANGDVLTFPQLRKLQLQRLGSVKSFYTVRSLPEEESFFNHQVECPVLEVLTIDGLSKIKKIWDEQSYKNFPNLKDLSIKDCHEIESIVSNQGKGNRVEANGDVLTFPQLRKLQLQRLGSVKSFYTVRSLPEEESFFNHQVECPVLEDLTIDGLSKIKKIWDEQSYKKFPNLKDLSIKYCHEIESIVSNQGKGNRGGATGEVVIFPQLRVLRLKKLRNIKSFYTLRSLPNQESFFKHQIIYPALERCEFLYIPKAKEVYEVKILPQLGSPQLKEICGHENKSQGVLLPKLRELGFEEEVIRGTPTGKRLNTVTDWIDFGNYDKRLFHPLFDAFFGLGRE